MREARIDVSEDPGKPGRYRIIAFLRRHFQLDEFSGSVRLGVIDSNEFDLAASMGLKPGTPVYGEHFHVPGVPLQYAMGAAAHAIVRPDNCQVRGITNCNGLGVRF